MQSAEKVKRMVREDHEALAAKVLEVEKRQDKFSSVLIMNSSGGNSSSLSNSVNKQDNHKHQLSRDVMLGGDLWTDGLICAFEFVRGCSKTIGSMIHSAQQDAAGSQTKQVQKVEYINIESKLQVESVDGNLDTLEANSQKQEHRSGCLSAPGGKCPGSYWIPIGWARITELVQMVQVDAGWASHYIDFSDDDNDVTVADIAAPYWQRPVGPTWWCHVDAGHPFVSTWLSNARWLHPAISTALRDESKLISERMKVLFYEVPVRVAGGLLFELLGQSAGDPFVEEHDIPVVLRSWQAQNFLVTALHIKGSASNINVLGILEIQELLTAGCANVPQTIHEVIALLVSRLARWDDRLFRKYIFGEADEVELKFMNRRTHEDMHLFSVILNQEIRRLSTEVIRVKWSLHAREEIVFELLQHLKGNAARSLLEGVRKSTREMIEEQEAVRGRLFTIQDVMQSTVRAWLQDQSLRVTHNLGVFGGCGLVLSIITGLFGINVDGIPGAEQTPYAFTVFSGLLCLLGIVLIGIGLVYLGLKKPVLEEQVEVRKLELQELVRMFQQDVETHAQVRKSPPRSGFISSGAAGSLPNGEAYVLIS
ncbi:hypothetical protein RJ639_017996 [Escallonia herrerae]|uniref:Magnesium transporter CorA-like family protein n=1 Tax=Escallonia herrerae TaxID=1293975 RepID=A0AA88V8C0_9ASTE|nr:hypothetical protein RJ639_017996 [Escallonia herrerae]